MRMQASGLWYRPVFENEAQQADCEVEYPLLSYKLKDTKML